MAEPTKIKIQWNGSKATCTPDPCPVASKNKLQWWSDDVNFAVFFIALGSPFDAGTLVLAGKMGAANGTHPLTIRKLMKKEKNPIAEKGFTYRVAILDPVTDTLFTKDPDIIVQDYGGGGGTGAKKSGKKQPKKAAAKPAKKKR